jgi:hypothetical protein
VVKTYTVENLGSSALNISAMAFSGGQTSDFSIGGISLPAVVAGNSSTTFTVTFNPSALGLRSTTLNLTSNDCDEGIYDFKIQGTGVDPEINIQGNSTSIVDGDVTPSLTDFTDFGSTPVSGGTVVRTYTIQNTGTAVLNISTITFTGTNAADFTPGGISLPATVAAGSSTTFTVTFDPSASGLRTATLNMANDDCDESTYDFAIQGTGNAPEINLKGNSISIVDGDITPATTDNTDFGNQSVCSGTVVKTYTIENLGNAVLNVNGITLTGTDAADFTVGGISLPTTLDPGSPITFTVTFNPSGLGVRSATVNIDNSDSDENPYDFAIQGTGVDPEANLTGNGVSITDGSATPSATDDTDFGNQSVCSGTVVKTYTIENNGTAVLNVTAIAVSGGQSADFTVGGISLPATVSVGSTATFTVTFNPSVAGLRTTTVTVTNNDCDEASYDFAIQGTGIDPEIDIQGNGVNIADGDNTPASADDTDFGSTAVTGSTVVHTFTINNTGTSDLTVTSLTITGTNQADFTPGALTPASPIPAGSSATFTVTFDPSAPGVRSATVTANNNDCDESVFDFAIQGTGIEPEMNVKGNGVSIADGDATPSASDDTDFGIVNVNSGTVDHTFTIENTNLADLNLTGTPKVLVSGANASDFTVTVQPSSPVAPSTGTTTFTVQFNPSATGVRTATISIDNDDANENPYDFAIQGTGALSEIAVSGNGQDINDGDTTPSATDDTDYGDTGIGGGQTSHTFTITNTGAANLVLSGTPKVSITGPGAAYFTVTAQPASPVPATTGSTTFTIKFQPSVVGFQTATVSIDNDDSDENPFNFDISGFGTDPEMVLTGNGVEIVDGDNTPSLADHTDFGSADINGTTIDRVYTSASTGILSLNLDGTPKVQISGANADEFSVVAFPTSPVPSGTSTTFTIRFSPAAAGLRTAVITIPNDDANEHPYTFTVQGTGTGVAPDINVKGNGISILDGDNTPSPLDLTDFGSSGIGAPPVTHQFTIENLGTAALNLNGTPLVTVTGPAASDFVVTILPNTPLAVGNTTTFSVQFAPTAPGLRTATISIASNDFYENPYDFAIQGSGLDQEIDLQGGSPLTSIVDGDTTPSTADGTDFGSQCVSAGTVSRTFTIVNSGGANLNLTGTPKVTVSGANPSDFTVTTQPVTPVGSTSSTTFTVTFNPSAPGLRTATLTIPNDDVTEDPYDFSIQGTGLEFNPVLSGTSTICNGSSANLTVNITGTGTGPYTVVYTDGSTNFTATNYSAGGNIPVSPTSNQTYSLVSVTDVNGCAASAVSGSATVTVNPIPDVTAPANQALCNGASTTAVSFTGSVSGTVFTWTNSTTSIGLAATGTGNIAAFSAVNNGTATVIATVTVTPKYTFNSVTCTGTAQTFTITVYPTPTVTTPANQTVCKGVSTSTITFSGAVSGTTFTWTNNTTSIGLAASGSGNIGAFTANNNGPTPVVATITVTPFANGCSGVVKSFTITVNPTPDVTIPANQTLCNGFNTAPVTFSGSVNGTTFAWTNTAPTIGLAASGTGNLPIFNATNTGAAPIVATITVTPTANGCPGTAQTFTYTVNPTPNVAAPTSQTLCNAANTTAITFTGSVSGTTFNWTNNTPSIGLAASGTGNIASFAAVNTGTAPVTATFTVTPAAGSCQGTAKTFTITVNPTPTVTTPTSQTLCNGANTTAVAFTGAVSGTTFAWTNSATSIGLVASGAGNIASFAAVNTGAAPVVATITVTPTANTCAGTAQTFTITVNPTPDVAAVTNQTLCNAANTTAIAFTGGVTGTTFNWTNNTTSIGLAASGTGNIASFAAANLTTVPVTATITVTPSASSCAGTAKTFTITVNPTPDVVPVTSQTLCNGANTILVSLAGSVSGTTFSWTNSTPSIGLAASGSGDIASFAAINTGVSPVTATITVTPTANSCTGSVETFTITVNPTPDVANVANQTACNGTNTTPVPFTGAVGGTTFAWTNNTPSIGLATSGNGNLPSFAATNNGNSPVTATITVTPAASGCPGTAKTFTITVNPTPNVSSVASQTRCNGANTAAIAFNGTVSGTTFNWTNNTPSIGLPATGSGDIASFAASNTGTSVVTATIIVTPTANTCVGSAQTFTITVNPTPDVAPVTNQSLCNTANSTQIDFTGTLSGTTFAWTNNTPSIGLASSGSGSILPFTGVNFGTTPATATITVTPSASSCPGTPGTFTITVNPTPDVVVPANQSVCNGSNTTAAAFSSSVSGTSFGWTNSNTSIGLAASGTGDIPAFLAVNTGASPVTATIIVTPTANGCTGAVQAFSITVKPTPDVTQPPNQTLCNGNNTDAVNFTGSTSGTTFTWTNSTPSIGLAASGTGNINSFVAVNTGTTAVTATITVTPTAGTCAGTVQTFTITVNPTPTVALPSNQTVCNSATTTAITFSSAVSGTTFAWTNNKPSIGLAASGTGDITAFTAVNTGTFPQIATIVVTPTANGCPGTAQTFTITVNPTPTVATVGDQILCTDANTTAVSFTGTVGGTTFGWTNSAPSIGLAASGSGDIASFVATNTGATPVIATIAVTPTANTCPGTPKTFTITVNPSPTVSPVTNQTLCNGGNTTAVNFTASVSGTTFTWSNTSPSIGLGAFGTGNIPSFAATNFGTSPVVATITVFPTANSCSGTAQTFTITVNPTPDVAPVSNQTLCNNTNTTAINFTGAVGGTTFAWTNNNAGIGLAASGSGNIAAFAAVNTGTSPVTATITVTPTANSCVGTVQTFTITVNPTPVVATVTNQSLCNGANTAAITFSANTGGTTFAWTNNNTSIGLAASGSGNIASFAAVNTGNSPITATISVVPTSNGCVGQAQTFTITVNPTPDVSPVADQLRCNNESTAAISFTGGVSGTTFGWTNSTPSIGISATGSGNIASFTAQNSGVSPVIATITVTPSANTCVGTPKSFTITVNPSPSADPIADQTWCNGAAVPVTALTGPVSGTVFVWSNDNPNVGLGATGTGDIPAYTATNAGTAPIVGLITVIPIANTCIGINQNFNVKVNPTPTVAAVANQTLCNNFNTAAINFSGTVSGTTFAWTNTAPSIGLAASGSGNIASFVAVNTGSGPVVATITVTPTANGCPGTAQTFTITVNPAPNAVPIPNQVVCNGSNTTSVAFTGGVNGTTYAWTNTTTSIGLAASGTGNIASFAALNSGTTPVAATISVTPSANGCPGIPQVFTITVNPTPTATTPADQTACNGAPTTAVNFSSNVSGATFAWTNSTPSIGLAASGTGNIASFTATNGGLTPVAATLSVTPTANTCVGTSQTFIITVNPTPDVTQPGSQTLCNGSNTAAVTFTGNTPGTTFDWSNSNPSIGLVPGGTGNIPAFTAVNTGPTPIVATITVTPTANSCSGPSTSFTITVNPTPDLTAPANQTLCSGTNTAAVNFTGSVTGTVYNWTNSTPSIGLAASGTGNIAAFNASNSGSGPVTATITVTPSANGCGGTAQTFTITVNPSPNVVAPGSQTLCNGANTTAVTFTGNTSGTTFNWTNSNTSIGLAGSGSGNIASFAAVNTGATAAVATITVTPNANGCNGTAQTFTITVNPTPNVTAPANQTLCNGSNTTTVVFAGSVSGTAFAWTNTNTSIGLSPGGNGDIPAFTAVNTGASPVTATITVTPSAAGCVGTAQTFTITVNPTPNVAAIGSQTLCNGANTTAVNFSGGVSGTTFNWTNSATSIGLAASGSGNIASFAAVNTGANPVIATITVTPAVNGCTGTAQTFTITVNPTPNVVVPANQTVCNGVSTNFIGFTGSINGTTYSWTNNTTSIGLAASGTGNIAPFTAANTGAAPVTATITVIPSVNGCTGTAQTFTITVNPTPNVDDPADQTVCNAANTAAVTFTGGVAGTTYTWTNNNTAIGLAASGTGNIASFAAVNTTPSAVSAIVTVTPTVNTCVGSNQTFSIIVKPTPTVADPADQTLCNGTFTTAVSFSGSVVGTTFAWTNDQPGIGLAASGSGNIPSFTAVNTGTAPVIATIAVTPTADGCAGPAQTFTITVNPTPNVATPASQTVCSGANTAAIAFTGGVSGTTFAWANTTTSIGLSATGTGNIASFTALNTGNATVTATITVTPSTNGCIGTPQSFTITVNPAPNVTQPASQTLCSGAGTASVTFVGSVSGTTFAWTNSTTSIGLAASGTGDIASFTAVNTGSSPVIATITVTPSAGGCTGTAQTFTITVNPTPDVTAPANQTLCNSATTAAVTFAGAVSGTTFSWTNSETSIGLAASGTGNIAAFTAANTGASAVTATITVTPAAGSCTGTAQTFTITVNPTPNAADPADQTVCNGSNTAAVTFSGTVSGTTFNWTNSNASIGLAASGSGDIASFAAVNTGATAQTATIVVTPSANGCQGAAQTFTITVNPTSSVTDPADQEVCNGTSTATVTFVGGVTGTNYTWTNNNISIGLAASGNGDIPSFTAVNTGTSVEIATITVTPNANGCAGPSQTFTITVDPAPNVVTPADQTVCNGNATNAITFTGNIGGTTFSWTNSTTSIGLSASGTGDIPSFTAVNSDLDPVIATITVTPSAGGCTGGVQTLTITVNPTPTVGLPTSQTLCNGETTLDITFLGTGAGVTYDWTNDDTSIGLADSGSGDIPGFTASNSGSVPVTANITVTPTAAGCVGQSQTFTITVFPTPLVICPGNISLDAPVNQCALVVANISPALSTSCAGASVTYTLTGATTGTGLDDASGVSFSTGVTTVTYKVTDAAGGSNTCTFTVTIHDAIPPTITCPAAATQNTDAGLCSAAVTGLSPVVTDNCPNTPYAYVVSGATTASGNGSANGVAFNKGVSTVTYTVTDASSNTATCSFTVTVNDGQAPTITCPANLVHNTDPAVCKAAVGSIDAVFTDNCPASTVAFSTTGVTTISGNGQASGSTFNLGLSTVKYTTTDASGNTASCTFTVTVADQTAPVSTCPANVTQGVDPAQCTAVVNNIGGTFTDNCSGVTIAYAYTGATTGSGTGPASGTAFNHGVTTLTYTATDVTSNTSTCSFTITIQENIPPTISCPADVNQSTGTGLCSATVNGIAPVFSDNCPGPVLSYAASGATTASGSGNLSGTTFNKGITTVIYTATDASTNTATCSFTVTISDNEAPVVSCPANQTVPAGAAACTAVVNGIDATSSDNCPGAVVSYALSGATSGNGNNSASGTAFDLGNTTVVYTVTDAAAHTATCSFTVTVNDNLLPQMICPPAPAPSCNISGQPVYPDLAAFVAAGGSATDNCGINSGSFGLQSATSNNQTCPETITRVYQVTDNNSNVSTCSQLIVVGDVAPPVLTLLGNSTVTLCLNATYTEAGATASDNCSGDLTGSIVITGSVNVATAGTYTITYTVTDGCGNTATQTRTVTVTPALVVSAGADAIICNSGNAQLNATESTGATIATYQWSPAAGLSDPAIANPVASPGATTTYTVVLTDQNGCTGSDNVQISVGAAVANAGADKSICAGGNTTLQGDQSTGNGTLTYSWSPVAGLSNATIANPVATPSVTTVYTLTVTDAAGCSSTDQVTITVNQALTVDAGADTGACQGVPANLTGSATGGGGGYTWSWTPTNGLSNPSAATTQAMPTTTTTYTLHVTDAAGCTGTDQVTVSVSSLPTLQIGSVACAPDFLTYTVQLTSNGVSVTATAGTVTDNGGGSFTINGIPAGANISVNAQNAAACTATQNITAPICACGPVSVPVSDGDKTICAGSPVPALSVSGYNNSTETIDWYDAVSGGTVLLAGNNQFTPTGAGMYYAQTRKISDPTCISSLRAVVSLIVNAVPTVNAGADTTICESGSTILSGSGSGGNGVYTYQWSPAAGLSDAAIQTPIATPAASGAFTLTVTDGNGCTATDQVNVDLYPAPAISVDGSTCAPDLLTFSVQISSTAASLTATLGTVTNNGSGSFTISGIPSNTGLSVTAQSAQGCQKTFPVNPVNCSCTITAPQSGGDQTICQGASIPALTVTVTDPGTETVDWYNAPTGGTQLLAGSLTYTPAAAGTYWAEARNIVTGTCVSSTRTSVALIINALPVVSITDPGVQCNNGGAITLNGSPVGGVFSGSGVTGSDFDPIVAQAGAHIIAYEVTDANSCSNTATVAITVNAAPVVVFTDPANLCINASPVALSATPAGGTFTGTGVSSGQFDPAVSGVGVYDLTYTATSNGCTASAMQNIEVWAKPTIDAGADIAACLPANIQLNATGTGAGTLVYQWNNSGSLSDPHIANPLAVLTGSETFTLTVTDGNGCSNSDGIQISAGGVLLADAGQDVSFCQGPSTQLHAQTGTVGTLTYAWSPAASLDNPAIANPTATPSASTLYTVTITNSANGCSGTDEVMVNVWPLPVVQAVSSSPICTGEALTLDELGGNGAAWVWSGPGGFAATTKTPVVSSGAVVAGDYTVLVTDVHGCTGSGTTSVAFASGAGASFESKFLINPNACVGDTIRFIDISDTISAGVSPTAFQWSFGDGGSSVARDPEHVYLSAGSYNVSVTVYDQRCPNYSIIKTMEVIHCKKAAADDVFIEVEARPTLSTGAFQVLAELEDAYEIRFDVYNSFGRLIETRYRDANIRFQESFNLTEPGMYFVKVRAGIAQAVRALKVVVVKP